MNFRPKIRRQSWKPRLKFPHKGKPRSTRGISTKRKAGSSVKHGTLKNLAKHSAAGFQPKSSRRLNRLPEWTDPRSYITKGGRHRLFGEDYERLRHAAYLRCYGWCECGCVTPALIEVEAPHPLAGQLAHKEHGSRKSDELDRVNWKNWKCHTREHNCGGKPITVTKKSLKEKTHAQTSA